MRKARSQGMRVLHFGEKGPMFLTDTTVSVMNYQDERPGTHKTCEALKNFSLLIPASSHISSHFSAHADSKPPVTWEHRNTTCQSLGSQCRFGTSLHSSSTAGLCLNPAERRARKGPRLPAPASSWRASENETLQNELGPKQLAHVRPQL